MKKALLKFFLSVDNPLFVKITCDEECEGEMSPLIGITPEGEFAVSVLDFEVDYVKSGKLWFNDMNLQFSVDTPRDQKQGVIYVKLRGVDDGVLNVGVQILKE